MHRILFAVPVNEIIPSVGLLLYRLIFGGFMVIGHGLPKLLNFGEMADKFADPIGIGSTASLVAAILGEFFCGILVMAGLVTRAALLPLIFTMGVAAFIVHADGPFFLPGAGAKEPALLYMIAYIVLLFIGPGRYSVDWNLSSR